MLPVRVQTEPGPSHERPALRLLSGLVRGLGPAGNRFLVLERIQGDPDVYFQVWSDGEGDYQVEHRAGSHLLHFQAYAASADEVVELMALWSRQEKDWDLGFAWERLDFPAAAPAETLPPAVEAELESAVRSWLRCGYDDRATLIERAEEHLVDGDVRPVSRAQAEELVARLWRERVAEQAGWTGESDPERLGRAFAALGAAGITARENFACCRGCGLAEIRAEGEEDARGFVFFHAQAAQGAADGGDLYLHYGGFATGDDEADAARTVGVGREVVAALGAVGLVWVWDGFARDAIRVTGMEWRKALVG
ncbi:hypothetical protein SAVIM338S_02294 [Streptomyces avidinii]